MKANVRKFYHAIAKRHVTEEDWNTTKIIVHDLDNKRLNRFYSLLKIHKPTLVIRPIVSNAQSVTRSVQVLALLDASVFDEDIDLCERLGSTA